MEPEDDIFGDIRKLTAPEPPPADPIAKLTAEQTAHAIANPPPTTLPPNRGHALFADIEALSNPAYTDPRQPLNQRVDAYVQQRVAGNNPWDQTKKELRDKFNLSDESIGQIGKGYESTSNMHQARKSAQQSMQREGAASYVLRRSVPFLSAVVGGSEESQYRDALKRIQEGKPSDGGSTVASDYDIVAHHEQLQKLEAQKGMGGRLMSGLAGIPSIVGEMATGGAAAKYVGGKAAARVGLVQAPRQSGMAGVPAVVANIAGAAAQTAGSPSMYVKRAEELQTANPDMSPAQAYTASLAYGTGQTLILGQLMKEGSWTGRQIARLPGSNVPGIPLALRTTAGVGEQQALDLGATALDKADQEMNDKTLGLDTKWGTLGKMLRSDDGRNWSHLGEEWLLFSAFSSLHGKDPAAAIARNLRPGERPTPVDVKTAPLKDVFPESVHPADVAATDSAAVIADAVNSYAKQGLSETAAAAKVADTLKVIREQSASPATGSPSKQGTAEWHAASQPKLDKVQQKLADKLTESIKPPEPKSAEPYTSAEARWLKMRDDGASDSEIKADQDRYFSGLLKDFGLEPPKPPPKAPEVVPGQRFDPVKKEFTTEPLPQSPAEKPTAAPETPPAASPAEAAPEAGQPEIVQPAAKPADALRAAAKSLVNAHLEASGLPPEQQAAYREATHSVLDAIPDAHLPELGQVKQVKYFADRKALTQWMADNSLLANDRQRASDKLAKNEAFGGFWDRSTGTVGLDGDGRTQEGTTRLAKQTHAHEFTHVLEGPNHKFSTLPEWNDAFDSEFDKGQLNRYSSTKPSEAFAEFGRLVYADGVSAAELAKKFPKATAFWQKHGLIPEKNAAEYKKPGDVFDGQPIDSGSLHIDPVAGKTTEKTKATEFAERMRARQGSKPTVEGTQVASAEGGERKPVIEEPKAETPQAAAETREQQVDRAIASGQLKPFHKYVIEQHDKGVTFRKLAEDPEYVRLKGLDSSRIRNQGKVSYETARLDERDALRVVGEKKSISSQKNEEAVVAEAQAIERQLDRVQGKAVDAEGNPVGTGGTVENKVKGIGIGEGLGSGSRERSDTESLLHRVAYKAIEAKDWRAVEKLSSLIDGLYRDSHVPAMNAETAAAYAKYAKELKGKGYAKDFIERHIQSSIQSADEAARHAAASTEAVEETASDTPSRQAAERPPAPASGPAADAGATGRGEPAGSSRGADAGTGGVGGERKWEDAPKEDDNKQHALWAPPVKLTLFQGIGHGLNPRAWAKRMLTSIGDLPQKVFDAKIDRDGSIGEYAQKVANTAKDLRKAAGQYDRLPQATIKLMDDALRGDIAALIALPPPVARVIADMRVQVDALSEALKRSGAIKSSLIPTVDANMGEYLTRRYRVFDDPKWRDNVDPAVVNRFETWLEAELRAKGGTPTADEIRGITAELLYNDKAAENPLSFISKSKLGSKDRSILFERKNVPDALRELWGEYTDPIINYANSVAKMSHLLQNHVFLDTIRRDGLGTYLHEKPDNTHYAKIDGGEAMAPLNGLYTTTEIKKAMEDIYAPKEQSSAMKWFMRATHAAKYSKTILSHGTQLTNYFGNASIALANGHWRIGKMLPAMKALASDTPAGRDYYNRLVRLGVVGDGVHEGEFKAMVRDVLASREQHFGVALTELSDRKLIRMVKAGKGLAEKMYRAGDAVWKVYAFEHEVQQYQKAKPGWTPEQVDEHAARVVRETYPTYSMAPKLTNILRRVPFIAPFATFPSEVVRTTYRTLLRAKQEMGDPDTRGIGARRMAGLISALTIPAAIAAATRALTGTSYDEEKAMRRFMPEWSRNNQLWHRGKDADGKIRYLDMGKIDTHSILTGPVVAFLRGQTMSESAFNALDAAAKPVTSEELLYQKLANVGRNKEPSGRPVYNEQDSRFQRGLTQATHIAEAFSPGSYTALRRQYMANQGIKEANGKTYDPAEEAQANLTGQRNGKVDVPQSLKFKGVAFAKGLAEANRAKDPDASRHQLFAELADDVQAARTLGLSDREIAGALKDGGVTNEAALAALKGGYVEPKPKKPAKKINPLDARR